MDTNVVVDLVESFNFVFGYDLLFSNFVASLNLLHEPKISIFDVALLEQNWSDFMLVCKPGSLLAFSLLRVLLLSGLVGLTLLLLVCSILVV